MPVLYSRPLELTYHAKRASCASCCTFLITILMVVVPYIAVYALGGLWTKELPAREQPLVASRYEILVEAYASSVSAGSEGSEVVPLLWSTSQPLNDAIGEHIRPCELRSWEEDDERDGYPDRLQYLLKIPLDAHAGERLHSVSVIIGVEAQFQKEFSLRLNSSLHLQASSPLPGKVWQQTADLALRSDRLQRSKDLPAREPCPTPVWAFREPVLRNGAPASTASILAQYAACNDTMVLDAQPPIWTPGVSETFEAHLTIRLPHIAAARRPGLVETLKLAAVQYIAFFLPIGYLLSCLHSALFRFGVVSARVHHPVKQHQW